MRERSSGPRLLKKLYPTRSESIRQMLRVAERLLDVPTSVLVTGETGAGKDYLAEALHRAGPRSELPFLKIDCAAIPAELFESELFGYEPGAFTDARARKQGKLELARGGTVYFDDLGSLDPAVQPKLLRVLQEKEFTRLGGVQRQKFDGRVISSLRTSTDGGPAGEIRADLLYRLNVVSLAVPPLRERKPDIPILSTAFVREVRRGGAEITPRASERLHDFAWPGNVRQLRNAIQRAALLAGDGPIGEEHLPGELLPSAEELIGSAVRQEWTLEEVERRVIERVLIDVNGNISAAARRLGISRKTLHEKIKKYS